MDEAEAIASACRYVKKWLRRCGKNYLEKHYMRRGWVIRIVRVKVSGWSRKFISYKGGDVTMRLPILLIDRNWVNAEAEIAKLLWRLQQCGLLPLFAGWTTRRLKLKRSKSNGHIQRKYLEMLAFAFQSGYADISRISITVVWKSSSFGLSSDATAIRGKLGYSDNFCSDLLEYYAGIWFDVTLQNLISHRSCSIQSGDFRYLLIWSGKIAGDISKSWSL